MPSFNQVTVVGHVTRDIELRQIPGSGTSVTDIGLAINDRRKKDDEWIEEVSFVDVTIWGRQAEVAAEYLAKGSAVLISGRLKQDNWENAQGEKRSKIKIVAEKMQLLGRSGNSQPAAETAAGGGAPVDGEAPF